MTRASHLIITLSADGEIDVFGGYGSEDAAQAVYDKLHVLLKATGTRMKLIDVPDLDPAAAAVSRAEPSAQAPASPPPVAEKPAPFRRAKSQAEFEAETIAMMNGEIPMDGIQFRDADAPVREGGAIS